MERQDVTQLPGSAVPLSLLELLLQLSHNQVGRKQKPSGPWLWPPALSSAAFLLGVEEERKAGRKSRWGKGEGETLGKDNGLCKIPLWAVWPSSMASGHMNSKKNVAQEFLPNDFPCLSLWEFGAADTFLP